MKKTTLLLLVLLLCTLWLTACGQTPLSPDGSVPQEESVSTTTTTTTEETTTTTEEITTTTTTTTTTATTTTTTAKVAANADGGQTRTEQGDGTTVSSRPISTHLVTPPSTQSGESTRKSTAKSAYVPPHLSRDTTDDTTTTTTGPTKDYTLPTVFTEEDRLPEVAVWTDKEVYGRTDKVTIYLRNLSDESLQVGNEFWLWEQVEGGWETVRDKNGRMAALYVIYPQTPSSDPLSVGMKLTDYDLKPNTRYMAGDLVYTAEGERWIGAEFMTAEE